MRETQVFFSRKRGHFNNENSEPPGWLTLIHFVIHGAKLCSGVN